MNKYIVRYFDSEEDYQNDAHTANVWGIYDDYESACVGVMACNIERDIKDSTDIRRAVLTHNGRILNTEENK